LPCPHRRHCKEGGGVRLGCPERNREFSFGNEGSTSVAKGFEVTVKGGGREKKKVANHRKIKHKTPCDTKEKKEEGSASTGGSWTRSSFPRDK